METSTPIAGKLRIVFKPSSAASVEQTGTQAVPPPQHSPLIVRLPNTRKRKQEEDDYVCATYFCTHQFQMPEAKRPKIDPTPDETPKRLSREERMENRRSRTVDLDDEFLLDEFVQEPPKTRKRQSRTPTKGQDLDFEVPLPRSGPRPSVSPSLKHRQPKVKEDNDFLLGSDIDKTPTRTGRARRQTNNEIAASPEDIQIALTRLLVLTTFTFIHI